LVFRFSKIGGLNLGTLLRREGLPFNLLGSFKVPILGFKKLLVFFFLCLAFALVAGTFCTFWMSSSVFTGSEYRRDFMGFLPRKPFFPPGFILALEP